MRVLYSLALYLALPLIFAYFVWRGLREPGYLRGWRERLGCTSRLPAGGIWLHAASVGEVAAAVPLVRALRRRYPDSPCLVTVFTPTGRERALAALEGLAEVLYLPLDLPGPVRRFLRRARPRIGILLEAELWPNLLHGCAHAGISTLLINARLSAAGATRYRRGPPGRLIGDALRRIDRIAAVDATDAARFAALGVREARIAVTGNLKFDLELPPDTEERGAELRRAWQAERRPVWIAASTHAGEEEVVLDAHGALLREYPDLLLVLVPRHPQRFDAVAELCRARGLIFARRSRDDAVDGNIRIVLGDTLGELPVFYAAADAAFVGGSLVPGVGGHNLLEPAALRLPLVTGMHSDNWQQAVDWLREAGALRRVEDATALADTVGGWLQDATGREAAGRAAARVVENHGGALERTLRLVSDSLTAGGR
jgi:3-deoxy-D-manno-octulosonic-acid transferase